MYLTIILIACIHILSSLIPGKGILVKRENCGYVSYMLLESHGVQFE